MIKVIVAMDKNRVIGADNKMPWHLPSDLKRFKAMTMGHWIVMGRKTFESIGKPLPGRINAVVSKNPDSIKSAEGILVLNSLDSLKNLEVLDDLFIIGGAEIYKQTLPIADMLYVTLIDNEFTGDAYFPEIKESDWELTEQLEGDPKTDNFPYSFRYLTYKRKNAS